MYDAVHLFFRALSDTRGGVDGMQTESLNCNKRDGWKVGSSLLNYLKQVLSVTVYETISNRYCQSQSTKLSQTGTVGHSLLNFLKQVLSVTD